MTDMELAEEIEQAAEHGDRGYERVWFTANGDLQIRCRNPDEIQAIIAALRRGPERPPSGEMVMVPREPTDIMVEAGQCAKRGADSEDHICHIWHDMIAAAEAEGRKG